jgi:site-specific recombinase XerD
MDLLPVPASPAHLPTLAELDAAGEEFQKSSRAQTTWKAYNTDWQSFVDWCEDFELVAMPATEETLSRYLTALVAMGRRPATLRRKVASISVVHETAHQPNPARSRAIRDRLTGIGRVVGNAQRVASPATTTEIRKMVAATSSSSLRGIRDRALVLLGFAAALRRSELAALDIGDIRWVNQGMELTIRRSKTDQEGYGAVIPVPYGSHHETCPVRAVGDWLEAIENNPCTSRDNSLFRAVSADNWVLDRLSDRGISRVVAGAAKRAELDPAGNWSGHSLRAGLATSAARAGVPDRVIMATTRHKSRATLDRYIREGKRWDSVASASVGL